MITSKKKQKKKNRKRKRNIKRSQKGNDSFVMPGMETGELK